MFYDIEDIRKKSLKFYNSGDIFRDYIGDEKQFLFLIKLKKIKQVDIQNSYLVLQNELKKITSLGLNIKYQEFNFKNIGTQKLPVEVVFNSVKELLEFIDKKDELDRFVKIYNMTVGIFPKLKGLVLQKPFFFLNQEERLDKLFLVCEFFINNPMPNIYLRELSISGVDTKFVEQNKKTIDTLLVVLLKENSYKKEIVKLSNYGFEKKYFLKYPLPLVRFRILDERKKIFNLTDLSLTIDEFKMLNIEVKNIFIVENKMTMLSFLDMKNSIVIFGSGYGVEILKDIDWLREKNIYYWGDIDNDGFAILSMLRGYFKDTKSIFMDKDTIDKFIEFSVTQDATSQKELKHLTPSEQKIYKSLRDGFRLEQEKIHTIYIEEKIYDYTF